MDDPSKISKTKTHISKSKKSVNFENKSETVVNKKTLNFARNLFKINFEIRKAKIIKFIIVPKIIPFFV